MTIQETLAQVRAKHTYDPTKGPTENECAAICNETAWIHRGDPETWGLSTKTTGGYGTLSDGSHVAADILQSYVTMEIFDCLVAAGWDEQEQRYGPATPSWQPKGVLIDSARPWKAPINPGTTVPPGPDPNPPTDLETRVLSLEADMKVVQSALRDAADALARVS
jgi:hypothetical protein